MNKPQSICARPEWKARIVSLGLRGIAFLFLWWILTEGILQDPLFVTGSIAIALWASYRLIPPEEWSWQPVMVIRFLPYFVWNSLLGGIDVASRAFRPSMPINPKFLEFPLHISGKPALLMAWTVSLLPGTASVHLEKDLLRIHVLDTQLPVDKKLRELERRIQSLVRE